MGKWILFLFLLRPASIPAGHFMAKTTSQTFCKLDIYAAYVADLWLLSSHHCPNRICTSYQIIPMPYVLTEFLSGLPLPVLSALRSHVHGHHACHAREGSHTFPTSTFATRSHVAKVNIRLIDLASTIPTTSLYTFQFATMLSASFSCIWYHFSFLLFLSQNTLIIHNNSDTHNHGQSHLTYISFIPFLLATPQLWVITWQMPTHIVLLLFPYSPLIFFCLLITYTNFVLNSNLLVLWRFHSGPASTTTTLESFLNVNSEFSTQRLNGRRACWHQS